MYKAIWKGNYLTLKNYKEPLAKIPKKDGIGFYGTLLSTLDGRQVQCHVCGELHMHLAAHIVAKHMPLPKYREKYGLARETSLISDHIRNKYKEATLKFIVRYSDIGEPDG